MTTHRAPFLLVTESRGHQEGLWCGPTPAAVTCASPQPAHPLLFLHVSPVTRETTRSSFPMSFLAFHKTMHETQTLTWPRACDCVPALQCHFRSEAYPPNLLNSLLNKFFEQNIVLPAEFTAGLLSHSPCKTLSLCVSSRLQQAQS